MAERYRRSFVLPNYTPAGWWECDVFEMTQAGFFREYEIKLTRSDFKADAKKIRERWNGGIVDGRLAMNKTMKHDRIGQPEGPSQFFYVCPRGLIKREELPPWAGLIDVVERPHMHRPPWNIGEMTIVPAPKLHKQKADPKILSHAEGVIYWRFHSLFIYGKTSVSADLAPPNSMYADYSI